MEDARALFGAIVFGGLLLVIGYVVGKKLKTPNSKKHAATLDADMVSGTQKEEERNTQIEGRGSKRVKSKKKREIHQEFSHPWMLGALKGHTAPVLDISFSSNGKFLASCAEADRPRTVEETLHSRELYEKSSRPVNVETRRAKGESSKDNNHVISQRRSQLEKKRDIRDERQQRQQRQRQRRSGGQQRRQRPRKIVTPKTPEQDNIDESVNLTQSKNLLDRKLPIKKSIEKDPKTKKMEQFALSKPQQSIISEQRRKIIHVDDGALSLMLHSYVLSEEERLYCGYPMETQSSGCAVILNTRAPPTPRFIAPYLNVNAREFVPRNSKLLNGKTSVEYENVDSGHCTESSVENSDLEEATDSSTDSDEGTASGTSRRAKRCNSNKRSLDYLRKFTEMTCSRCYRLFFMNRENHDYLRKDEMCVYHWGKLRNGIWQCCSRPDDSDVEGCTEAKTHVWCGLLPGYNGPISGYVTTKPCPVASTNGNYGMYAVDCEMCFTKHGLELARVSLVDTDGHVIYDTFVKPEHEIIDHNTRFSGVTAADIASTSKTIVDVQNDLLDIIYAETILIGHALENDLKALKILHENVVDTSVAYPHECGFPMRYGLKTLAKAVLNRDIQGDRHDSVEDARAAADLMLKKVESELEYNADYGAFVPM